MADWSALPSDVLALIADRLSFAADARFRAVCRSWRSAYPHRPLNPLYLIATPRDDDDGEQENSPTLCFFNISCVEMRALDVTGHCRGSSHGWIALLDQSITLFNPVSRRRIKLPNFPQESVRVDTNKVILSSDPSSSSPSSSSSSNCVVLAIRHDWKRIEFCRLGDDSWIRIPSATFEGPIIDSAYYKGSFYVASYDSLYVCDVEKEPGIAKVEVQGWTSPWLDDCHLVEAAGDLVMVTLYFGTNKSYTIRAFKFIWREDSVILVNFRSLSSFALFLSRIQSVAISARRYQECRRNCIYLAEYYMEDKTLIRIFDLKKRRYELVTTPSSIWWPCTWFTPSRFL